jgi:predicted choloylglycine hydrolase
VRGILGRYAPALDTTSWWEQPPVAQSIRLRSVASHEPGDLVAIYRPLMPAFRAWYLRADDHDRPSLQESREALSLHMPQLLPIWDALRDALAGDDEVLGRFLTAWDPPTLLHNCSTVVFPGDDPVLARNYDYDPSLIDGVLLETHWAGRRVVGTADQVWGLLDGVNDAGLAASFTYGGRPEVGRGFGIPLVIRYLLQTCDDVEQAVLTLCRLPIHVAYNVSLVDVYGGHATVFVGPTEVARVTRNVVTTNHQERVHWPEHAARYASVERAEHLTQVVTSGPDAVVDAMLEPPVRADRFHDGFGTIYTAVYEPVRRRVTYRWPGQSWQLRIGSVTDEERAVSLEASATTRWDAWRSWHEPAVSAQ